MKVLRIAGIILLAALFMCSQDVYAKKKYDFTEAMKFEVVKKSELSKDGKWAAYTAQPDRGDPTGYVKSSESDSIYAIKNGINPQFTNNSKWAGFIVKPKSIDVENADKKKPKNGMVIVNLSNGTQTKYENVKSFLFSEDSRWAAITLLPDDSKKEGDLKVKSSGLMLMELEKESHLSLSNVLEFVFDSLSNYLAYIVEDPTGKENGVYAVNLKGGFALPQKIEAREKAYYTALKWSNRSGLLGYVSCNETKDKKDSNSLMLWNSITGELRNIVKHSSLQNDWFIPYHNKLTWSDDDKRLFFGVKPYSDSVPKEEKITITDTNFYDIKTILKKINLDIWHWNDPRIKTNERKWWEENKDRTFTSVYYVDDKSFVQLADLACTDIQPADNDSFLDGYDETPYLKEGTWEGEFFDLYNINIRTGQKKLIAKKLSERASLSPNGNYIVYFKDKNWYLYNNKTDSVENLTKKVGQPFYDEDNDVPAPPNSYGVAGWLENDAAVMIYDKYDIWTFYTGGGYISQTALEGRDNKIRFRLVNLDPKKKFYTKTDNIWTSGFNEKEKETGIFKITFSIIGPEMILWEKKKFRLLEQSENGKIVLYSRESYDEVPDLWLSDSTLKSPKRITNYNKQLENYNWGTAELVHWVNFEGDSLDGIIYKPANYDPKKRYPVLVYYYERFSDQLYNFNSPYIGHRPCYQIYNDDGYVFFLPDVKFKTGNPGYSSVSCIVSGIRHLAKIGLADTNALGITGHSWSGYQTAFMVTQTNIFAAAVAGAPVSNMTSAYSGIRLGTGLARQFQYEMGQSRIGGNVWDSLDAYIRNSPVFQAKKTTTPLMIMFGDEDWAVPWQQGQELYLAWRRLNKNIIFLEYFDEPHWPEKFPDRLDYAIRMKEFFDTYCLKKPAPDWILNGVRYKGTED